MNKEGEDVRLQNKMVENIKAQPVDSIILLTNFMSECKRLGCISFYREKNDDKKIQFFIGGPEYTIVDWYFEIMDTKRKCTITYEKWKELTKRES